jgi:hypothetical protein
LFLDHQGRTCHSSFGLTATLVLDNVWFGIVSRNIHIQCRPHKSETVGGPVDVAIISKYDGFIWIKRKHYFDKKQNPFFRQKYFKEVKNDVCFSNKISLPPD